MKKILLNVLIIAALCITSLLPFSGTAEAETVKKDCPTCEIGKPESTGSKKEQNKASKIVRSSDEFKSLNKQNKYVNKKQKDWIINVNAQDAVVTVPVEDFKTGLTSVQYYINLNTNDIVNVYETYITADQKSKTVNLTIEESNEVVIAVDLNSEGNIVESDGNTLSIDEFLVKDNEEEPIFSTFGACETTVRLLYDAANAGSCYLACLRVALINIGVGLGCGAICVIIKNNSKSKVVDIIC